MSAPAPLGLEAALDHVLAGGLLGFPTETVWGLGADARAPEAVAALRRFKGRPLDKPLSLLVEGIGSLDALEVDLPDSARRVVAQLWPGPLTLVLGSRARLAPGVARSDGALGVRCSSHPVARALAAGLARRGAGPLTATSLNRAGERPARTRDEAASCSVGEAALALAAGEDAGGGAPSGVLDLSGPEPVLLREGADGAAAMRAALGLEDSP